jgi:hypothetical protein
MSVGKENCPPYNITQVKLFFGTICQFEQEEEWRETVKKKEKGFMP